MKQDQSRVLLYSGGLDSYIAWHYLDRPPTLYFSIGHKYMYEEIAAIARTIPKTEMAITLRIGAWERDDAHIPARNAFLVLAAAVETDAEVIYLVVQRDEMEIADRSSNFLSRMSALAMYLLERRVVVETPFADMDKTEMVEWYLAETGDVDALLRTRSCYRTGTIQCGACAACIRRFIALRLNGIEERYETNPLTSPAATEYRRKAQAGEYSARRCERILEALRR